MACRRRRTPKIEEGNVFAICDALADGHFSKHRTEEWAPHKNCIPIDSEEAEDECYWTDEPSDIVPTPIPIKRYPTFEEHLANLPEWERSLFQNLEFLVPIPELFQLCEAAATGEGLTLISMSDGSAMNKTMSFGWFLALQRTQYSGTRLVKCSGPAYGAKESSYRSEGYGILSPTRFLLHLFQYHQCEPKWNYQYSADNESILNKLIEDLKYDLPYPNTVRQENALQISIVTILPILSKRWNV